MLLLLTCVFPEHFATLAGEEPAPYTPRKGDNFWTGELLDWTAISSLWHREGSLRLAVHDFQENGDATALPSFLKVAKERCTRSLHRGRRRTRL